MPSQPQCRAREGTTAQRSAFPVRSPIPLTVPWTSPAPARTAARLLATARPASLWQWMPRVADGSFLVLGVWSGKRIARVFPT